MKKLYVLFVVISICFTGFSQCDNPPSAPEVACYEEAILNPTTCLWEIIGTQEPAPTVSCYEITEFDNDFCEWVVIGDQPSQPSLAC